MLLALLLALVMALVVAVLGAVFARPRKALLAWCRAMIRRVLMKDYRERVENMEHAIARQAADMAQFRCNQDGNPDDEFWSDWYRWYTGDPDANVDYSRKQQRDAERLRRGEFGPMPPRPLKAAS